jgi:hypothetical protein
MLNKSQENRIVDKLTESAYDDRANDLITLPFLRDGVDVIKRKERSYDAKVKSESKMIKWFDELHWDIKDQLYSIYIDKHRADHKNIKDKDKIQIYHMINDEDFINNFWYGIKGDKISKKISNLKQIYNQNV